MFLGGLIKKKERTQTWLFDLKETEKPKKNKTKNRDLKKRLSEPKNNHKIGADRVP